MINSVSLMGRLVATPELKTTQSGLSVTTIRLAVDRPFAKGDRGDKPEADFFGVVAWRGTAEFVARNFDKGNMIGVTGRLQSRSYTDKEGKKHTVVEVVADGAHFCGESKAVKKGSRIDGEQRSDGEYNSTTPAPNSPYVMPDDEYAPF